MVVRAAATGLVGCTEIVVLVLVSAHCSSWIHSKLRRERLRVAVDNCMLLRFQRHLVPQMRLT